MGIAPRLCSQNPVSKLGEARVPDALGWGLIVREPERLK